MYPKEKTQTPKDKTMNTLTFDTHVHRSAVRNGFDVVAKDDSKGENYRRLSSVAHKGVLHVTADGDFFVVADENGNEISRIEYDTTMFVERLDAVFSQAANEALGICHMEYGELTLYTVFHKIYDRQLESYTKNNERPIISMNSLAREFMNEHRDGWCKAHKIDRKKLTKDSEQFDDLANRIALFTYLMERNHGAKFSVHFDTESKFLTDDEVFAIFQA